MSIEASEAVRWMSEARLAKDTLTKLVDALAAWRSDNYLFNSNIYGDRSPSITVSAIAALAFHEVKHPLSQFTCDTILGIRVKDDPDKGAWLDQNGNYCHTYAASWAMFSCLRVRPSCVVDLADTVRWIMNQRVQGSRGWGHVQHSQPRAFDTAFVLNALLEFTDSAEAAGRHDLLEALKLADSIADGVGFLEEDALDTGTDGTYLWDREPKGSGVCIATTAISLHVLSKYYRLHSTKGKLSPLVVRISLDALCSVISLDALAKLKMRMDIPYKNLQVEVDMWPDFHSNSPHSYWNSYFTPILAVTLLDFHGITQTPALEKAIMSLVQWVISNTKLQRDGHHGVLGRTGSSAYVWSTAQGVIILRRWLDYLEEALLRRDSPIAISDYKGETYEHQITGLAQVLALNLSERFDIQKILEAAGLPQGQFLLDGVTAEQSWHYILTALKRDPNHLLLVFLCAVAAGGKALNSQLITHFRTRLTQTH